MPWLAWVALALVVMAALGPALHHHGTTEECPLCHTARAIEAPDPLAEAGILAAGDAPRLLPVPPALTREPERDQASPRGPPSA